MLSTSTKKFDHELQMVAHCVRFHSMFLIHDIENTHNLCHKGKALLNILQQTFEVFMVVLKSIIDAKSCFGKSICLDFNRPYVNCMSQCISRQTRTLPKKLFLVCLSDRKIAIYVQRSYPNYQSKLNI